MEGRQVVWMMDDEYELTKRTCADLETEFIRLGTLPARIGSQLRVLPPPTV